MVNDVIKPNHPLQATGDSGCFSPVVGLSGIARA
jgi:hypothetical protein